MSMEKKAEYRFNIILNPGDPMHKTAINALNSQGRHKSQFIVNAIVHYLMNDADAGKSVLPDKDEIKEICREVIGEMLPNKTQSPMTLIQEDEVPPETVEEDFDFGAIADTLSGFRKK